MKRLPTLIVALGVVSEDNRLLVVKTSSGSIELLGVTQVVEGQATSRISKLISELSLKQSPQKTLYLPQLKDHNTPKKSKIGVVHLVQLKKGEEIDVPNSRFEDIEKLASMNEASPIVRAVAKWLLKTNA
jgi:hypothetical protein